MQKLKLIFPARNAENIIVPEQKRFLQTFVSKLEGQLLGIIEWHAVFYSYWTTSFHHLKKQKQKNPAPNQTDVKNHNHLLNMPCAAKTIGRNNDQKTHFPNNVFLQQLL